MTTLEHTRPARFRATRSSLYAGVAMALGLIAAPSFAQTASSDPQAENAALRKEIESLRQRLADLQHQRQDGSASSPAASATAAFDPRDGRGSGRIAEARSERADDGADADILVTASSRKGSATPLLALKTVPKAVAVVTPAELKVFDEVSLPDALSRLGNVRWNDGNSRTGSFSMRGITASPGNPVAGHSAGQWPDALTVFDHRPGSGVAQQHRASSLLATGGIPAGFRLGADL